MPVATTTPPQLIPASSMNPATNPGQKSERSPRLAERRTVGGAAGGVMGVVGCSVVAVAVTGAAGRVVWAGATGGVKVTGGVTGAGREVTEVGAAAGSGAAEDVGATGGEGSAGGAGIVGRT
jgi:hypothetical protein